MRMTCEPTGKIYEIPRPWRTEVVYLMTLAILVMMLQASGATFTYPLRHSMPPGARWDPRMAQTFMDKDQLNAPPGAGVPFPEIDLPAPALASERAYLGLMGDQPFRISQLSCDGVVVILFSVYCVPCRKEVPKIRNLVTLLNQQSTEKNVKVLGIAVGNTPKEIELFRKEYEVNFPLIPDYDFDVHISLGELRTPATLYVRLMPGNTTEITRIQVGSIGDPEDFAKLIKTF